jgi:hypothetical protein
MSIAAIRGGGAAMRITSAVILTLLLLAAGIPALAGPPLGPVTPQSLPGKIAVGAGYSYQASRWKTGIPELNMARVVQNFWYASIAYGLAPCCEACLRVGMADLTSSPSNPERSPVTTFGTAFSLPGQLNAGYEPYLSLGLRAAVLRRAELAIGACFQLGYYLNGTAETAGTEWRLSSSMYDDYVAQVEIEDRYDLSAGITLDVIGDWGLFYAGGFYFRAAGKASGRLEWKDEPFDIETFSSNIEENGSLGGEAGLTIIVRKGWQVTVEGQYRSKSAIALSLQRAFGT